jgi:endonuclease YncB( thermonuclease family)
MRPPTLAFLILVLAPTVAIADDFVGSACVIDGDTLVINGTRQSGHCKGGTRIRLYGIDTPELKQTCTHKDGREFMCGQYAASILLKRIGDKKVECKGIEWDRYKRLVAECFVEGASLNAYMVREGWAVAYRRYSKKFVPDEEIAKLKKCGLWAMQFQMPWEWRKQR